jgi:hypothetical protein
MQSCKTADWVDTGESVCYDRELERRCVMSVAEILNTYRANLEWVGRNYSAIAAQHNGRYVAIKNQSVIETGDSVEAVRDALARMAPSPSLDEVAIVYITTEPMGILL